MKELENNKLLEINGGCLWNRRVMQIVTRFIQKLINGIAII